MEDIKQTKQKSMVPMSLFVLVMILFIAVLGVVFYKDYIGKDSKEVDKTPTQEKQEVNNVENKEKNNQNLVKYYEMNDEQGTTILILNDATNVEWKGSHFLSYKKFFTYIESGKQLFSEVSGTYEIVDGKIMLSMFDDPRTKMDLPNVTEFPNGGGFEVTLNYSENQIDSDQLFHGKEYKLVRR